MANPKSYTFAGFVLLENACWDIEKLKEDLKSDWNITVSDKNIHDNAVVWNTGKTLLAVSLIQAPVPGGEAEKNAENNYRWKDAVEVTKKHTAHLLVAALGKGKSAVDTGELYVKVCASCLKQKNALGIYTSGTVFQSEFYIEAADLIKEGSLPVLNWIYFGLCRGAKGLNGYTCGLTSFGMDEIEVLDSNADANAVCSFLYDIAGYIIEGNVTLQGGETIGLTEDQKFKITRSEGVFIPGQSLKIAY